LRIEDYMLRYLAAALLGVFLALPVPASAQNTGRITVFGAASLTNTLEAIGREYERTGGKRVVFSFAASMTLAKQIEASSGADIFISADAESMDYLEQRNLIARPTRQNLLGNRLVLIAPADSKVALTIGPRMKLAEALAGGRLAVANVDSVPAGRYGKAALTALGVWPTVQNRLAQGDDVRTSLAYVARGEAPLGIVYATDARVEPRVKVVGTFPASSHPPIVYPAAMTADANSDARPFLAYLRGPQARAVFERAGFTVLSAQQ
jgi:molybdate transport system substrate-binding protein